jgi:hypothetical protein
MVEAATGINLWQEWVRLEILGERYELPERRRDYGAVIVSLANQEHPDTSSYTDREINYRVQKHHHVGFVLASPRRTGCAPRRRSTAGGSTPILRQACLPGRGVRPRADRSRG